MIQSSRLARQFAIQCRQRGSWQLFSAEERISHMASLTLGSMTPKKEYFGKSDGWTAAAHRVPFETVVLERNQQQHTYASSTQREENDVAQTGMILPSMQELRKLNPEIAEIMEMHEKSQRSLADDRILKIVETALDEHNVSGKKSTKVTKTALMKLKVNILRGILEKAGSDARGNKAALVDRILVEIRKEEENKDVESIASNLGAGVVNRKTIVKFSRLKDIQHGRSKTPIMQTQVTVPLHEPAQFSRVFSGPDEVAKLLVDANAEDVAIIDVRGACSFTDYMVIASGRSHEMVSILANTVFYELKKRAQEVAPGVIPSVEGSNDDSHPEWLVVDAGSIVVHVFHKDYRSEYDLEGLWGGEGLSNVIHVAIPQHRLTRDTIQ